jgi:hypothetical protein
MVCYSLKYLNKLIVLEEKERKKHKEETRQDS